MPEWQQPRGNPVIRAVRDGAERAVAAAFIRGHAFERYGCEPPEQLPALLLVAYDRGRMVGTIGLDLGSRTRPLPLESTWAFARETAPLPFVRTHIVQFSRWFAERGVGMPLLAAAARMALGRGKLYFLVEAHRVIADHVEKVGCRLLPIPGARLLLDRIPPAGRAYYLKETPALCMQELGTILRAAGSDAIVREHGAIRSR